MWVKFISFIFVSTKQTNNMLLIGLKTDYTCVGVYDTDYSSVRHQQTDIIAGSPSDTKETLSELYHEMVKKAERSQNKLSKIENELEYSNMTEAEYLRKTTKLLADIKILRYDRVLIVDGVILK